MIEKQPIMLPDDEYNRTLLANVHPVGWVNPNPAARYNLVVIGGGSAGLVAAIGAAGLGAKVALVERHLLGGDCLNVGCVPSKTILRTARAVGAIQRAGDFGVATTGEVTVDFGQVMARMRRVRAAISPHDSAQRVQSLGIDLFLGDSAFVSPTALRVGDATLNFRRAVIATGSRPSAPPILGLEEAGYLTNETVWSLTTLPKRLAVIGGGPIGCELAQAFRRFGAAVTLFDVAPRLLGREDADAAALIERTLVAEGITVATAAQLTAVRCAAGARQIAYRHNGADHTLEVDAILVAAGRRPNVEGLGLEQAEVAYDAKGVTVDATLRTTNPAVYAAGDIALPFQFTHVADASARLVLQNALFPTPKKKVTDLIVPWCTYTDPEVAHVGIYDYEQVVATGQVDTLVQPLAETDRGRADGEREGFVKVHVRRGSDRIVAATLVAPHAGEMVGELTVAMAAGKGLRSLATVIHPYPTQAEAIKRVADAYNRTRLTPTVSKLFGWWFARTR